jgi:uncharacterized metal-binding protein YceD (DUF177 family)
MNSRRAFDIAFVGLSLGLHEFEYAIDDKFFEPYEQQDFENCLAKVKLVLEKSTSFMLLKFEVGGKLDVLCDRCGNGLTMNLWDEFNIVVKLVEDADEMNETEEDPDVYYINRTESHLQLSDWIYEFINLSIPMTKTCADDEKGQSLCNKEVLAKLKKMKDEIGDVPAQSIWKGLDKFKDLEN